MPKRTNPSNEGPPRKKSSHTVSMPTINLKSGEVLTDLLGKQWKLGKSVGVGGFGEIYLASDKGEVTSNSEYVAKVEAHSNGPLFVEINCYLRIAKKHFIDEWKALQKTSNLGMPHYIASGSHVTDTDKYRFLIIPRFEKDLENIFVSKKCKFNLKTVLTIALQLLDTLEYIHSKGYVHSDIKASNLLLKNKHALKDNKIKSPLKSKIVRCNGMVPLRLCKAKKMHSVHHFLRPNKKFQYVNTQCFERNKSDDLVFLLDFGLASKYLHSNGEHKKFCSDERKAHAGTILFCSLDAHKGAQSRRSDLESLGYNMVYWLTSRLPWMDIVDPQKVHKKKQESLANLDGFLNSVFQTPYPKFMYDYFKYLAELEFTAQPDYQFCRMLFREALKDYGYADNSRYDFDNLEGWGNIEKKNKNRRSKIISYKINRVLLTQNLPVKPELRKKRRNKEIKMLNWSQILMDPEVLLKQRKSRDRKLTETSDSGVTTLDIDQLNPTCTMLEVYNKSMERVHSGSSPKYKGDSDPDYIEGYTPTMMAVYNRKKEREELELEKMVVNSSKSSNKSNKRAPVCRKKKITRNNVKKTMQTRNSKSSENVESKSSKRAKGARSCRG